MNKVHTGKWDAIGFMVCVMAFVAPAPANIVFAIAAGLWLMGME